MNYCLLKNALVFKITGRHAERYLNARLSNNVKNLNLQQGQFAACITAQGRTQVYGAVLKLDDGYLYLVDGGDATEVKQHIRQFIVADQVDVADLSSEYQVIHLLFKTEDANLLKSTIPLPNLSSELKIDQNSDFISYTRKRSDQIGIDLICKSSESCSKLLTDLQNHSAKEISLAELAYLQIKTGIVTYPNELKDIFFPEAQLDAAISDNKGCYCGQEAVEMVRSRGKLPATLVVYQASGHHEIAKDSNLYAKDDQVTAVAKVLSSAYSEKENMTAIFVRLRQNVGAENAMQLVESGASEVIWKAS